MKWWSPAPALVMAGLLAGCVSDVERQPDVDRRGDVVAAEEESTYLGTEGLRGELRSLIRDVNAEHGGRSGVAVATADGVAHSGLSGNSWAWSTIKVPVAIVADERGVASEELIEASISSSDNDAAYALSTLLEGDYGELPHVPEITEPPGETTWRLEDQALFATQLPCVDEAGATYEAMGDIVEWQQRGLAEIPEAHFKGGWGYDTDTIYTLRQFGTAEVDGGVVGLALITHPDDGSHDTAEAILDDLGGGLKKLLYARSIGPAVTCSA